MTAATAIKPDIDEAEVTARLDALIPRLMAEHAFEHGARTDVEVVMALRAVRVTPDEISHRLPTVMSGLRNIRSNA